MTYEPWPWWVYRTPDPSAGDRRLLLDRRRLDRADRARATTCPLRCAVGVDVDGRHATSLQRERAEHHGDVVLVLDRRGLGLADLAQEEREQRPLAVAPELDGIPLLDPEAVGAVVLDGHAASARIQDGAVLPGRHEEAVQGERDGTDRPGRRGRRVLDWRNLD